MIESHLRESREYHGEQTVFIERMIFEWIRSHLRFAEVVFGKGVRIDDQDSVRFQVRDVRLERGRVHGDEDVHSVAGRKNFIRREMELIAADAGEGSGRGANFGGAVRERGDVVAVKRDGVGVLTVRKLHAVAGSSGEAQYGTS